ncbi:TIGR02453 family protein [Hoeflea sp. YIM 152468]|uniref:TIGR02453 family protein n=1 Tax=Hoeflea sp. YIM 152468 TaxID=3031759 RepID=UPI0023DC9113|nr:TIGR02453 family protein [Hoeflea sp. YIM 152468]MDF1607460.1 TIGR02453 family protein [Hoeflea sp. YIM 152468]
MSTGYQGFGDKALPFLKALGFHQNRDWFHDNKELFEEHLNEPRGRLIDDLAARLAESNIPLTCNRKSSTFRINRDIRFAKQKHPYNTHVSAVITRSGTKKDQGLLYFHVSPGDCFLSVGFYAMEPDELRAFRDAIVTRRTMFDTALEPLIDLGYVFDQENSLKRTPRGFEQITDPETLALIRLRHLTLSRPFAEERLEGSILLDDLTELAEAAQPFLSFGWRVLDPVRAARNEKQP